MTADALPDMTGRNCATGNPEDYFPPDARTEHHATLLCHACPHIDPCLTYALAHDVQGVWGGTSYQQRRDMRRQGRIRARPVTSVLLVRTPDANRRRALFDETAVT